MNENFPIKTNVIPQNPKIILHLRGLGVLCFSADHNRAEIGYLDIEKHDAMISMFDSKGKVVIPYSSLRGVTLEVLSPEKDMGKCYHRPDSPRNFDRMIDLSDIYGAAAEFKKPLPLQSRIYIDNAVFFTDPKSINTVVPFDLRRPSNESEPLEVGEGLFAYTASQEVTLKFNGQDFPLDPEESYIICILSGCRNEIESDFKHYYEILENAGDVQYNLKHPDGAKPWFNDRETHQFGKLADEFMKLSGAATDDGDDRERQDFLVKLQYLRDILCAPEPCLKVTFANRPRNLD